MKLHSREKMENRQYKLSIITICFNNADGLDATLNSTLGQQLDFCDFEQIVVDGGSIDSTMEIIQKYQDRLSWWCSEPDNGIYNAMNKGVAHATGEYLLFLNSGDIILENSLSRIFANDFSEDLVYANIYTRNGDITTLIKSPTEKELTPAYLSINTLPHQATLIRRDLHNRLNGYDETMKISAAPKFLLDALVGANCTVRYLDMAYSVFDRSGISSDITYLPSKLKEWQSFLRPYFGDFVADSFYRSKIAEKLVSRHVVEFVTNHPEAMSRVVKKLNDIVRDMKHNAQGTTLKKDHNHARDVIDDGTGVIGRRKKMRLDCVVKSIITKWFRRLLNGK